MYSTETTPNIFSIAIFIIVFIIIWLSFYFFFRRTNNFAFFNNLSPINNLTNPMNNLTNPMNTGEIYLKNKMVSFPANCKNNRCLISSNISPNVRNNTSSGPMYFPKGLEISGSCNPNQPSTNSILYPFESEILNQPVNVLNYCQDEECNFDINLQPNSSQTAIFNDNLYFPQGLKISTDC